MWFEWHNGVDQRGPAFGAAEFQITGRGLLLLSLEGCIAYYRHMRNLAERLERKDGIFTADEPWPPRWLPLLGTGSADLIALDCDVPAGDASPVHYVHSHDVPQQSREPRTPSLADAVALWVTGFDRGLWTCDVEQRRWRERPWDEVGEDLRRSGLV